MFPYWTLFKYGIPFIIGGLLLGGAAWKIQGVRLDSAKAELTAARSVYESNMQTISGLKAEVEKAQKSCDARISGKDQTIKRLKQIDDLKGNNETVNSDIGNDRIFPELNRMWEAPGKN